LLQLSLQLLTLLQLVVCLTVNLIEPSSLILTLRQQQYCSILISTLKINQAKCFEQPLCENQVYLIQWQSVIQESPALFSLVCSHWDIVVLISVNPVTSSICSVFTENEPILSVRYCDWSEISGRFHKNLSHVKYSESTCVINLNLLMHVQV
jgi:hypothetical protein